MAWCERDRDLAVLEDKGERLCLRLGEVPADLPGTAEAHSVDRRRRFHLATEVDRQREVVVLLRDGVEEGRVLRLDGEVHDPSRGRLQLGVGRGEDLAGRRHCPVIGGRAELVTCRARGQRGRTDEDDPRCLVLARRRCRRRVERRVGRRAGVRRRGCAVGGRRVAVTGAARGRLHVSGGLLSLGHRSRGRRRSSGRSRLRRRRSGVGRCRRGRLRRRRSGGGLLGRAGGRVRVGRAEHRAEEQLGRAADLLDHRGEVLHAWELHDDVAALGPDVRAREAEPVRTCLHDAHNGLQLCRRRLLGRLEDHREAALEVEAELGRPSRGDDASKRAEADEAHQDNTHEQVASQRLPPPLPSPAGWLPSASSPGSGVLSASRGGTEYGSLSSSIRSS